MTAKDVMLLRKYRADGLGYRKIAKLLGISENTVKTYINRHGDDLQKHGCLTCGRKLTQRPHAKQRRFCSDACRGEWWNNNQNLINRTTHEKVCCYCKKTYTTYRKIQKYCSVECSAAGRRKGVAVNG